MKDKVKVIIFDADDTLWDNQTYFDRAEEVFTEELKEYGTAEELSEELYRLNRRICRFWAMVRSHCSAFRRHRFLVS